MNRVACALLSFALVAAGCAGGGAAVEADTTPSDDPGPVHVHGLGINPADGALFVATHTGLYRVGPGKDVAVRVGRNAQDTMGFTVVGPNHFLGSGHPDVRQLQEENWPPHLGLIESRDAGATWTPISLLGKADFHVLRVAGNRVYGFDASNSRLLVSDDGGVTWRRRDSPAVLDLVPSPTNTAHVVAATERGLLESTDAGRTWRRLSGGGASPGIGFLAWPSRPRLVLVDADGRVWLSTDVGRTWRARGQIGGQPGALAAITDDELYVALHDGTIKQSGDQGASWHVRSRP
jgi:hypothetical protein